MERTEALDSRIKAWFMRVPSVTKWAFGAGCVMGLITHIFYISNMTMNEDFYIPSGASLTMGYAFGRWFLGSSIFFLRYGSPAVVGILAVILLSLSAALIVYCFGMQSKVLASCFSMLVVTFPSAAYLSGYIPYFLAYIEAFLLAILAFVTTEKGKLGWMIGAIFLCLSLGIYQAYISVTMTLCLSGLLFAALQPYENVQSFWRAIRIKTLKYVGMGGLGITLYFILLKVIFTTQGYVLQDNYTGITEIGKMTFSDVLNNFVEAYKNFGAFFLQSNLFKMSVVGQVCIYIILLIALFSGVLLLIRIPSNWQQKLTVVILFTVLPLSVNIINIVAPKIGIRSIGCNAYSLIFGILIYIIEQQYLLNKQSQNTGRFARYLPIVTAIVTLLVSFDYYLLTNFYYMKADAFYKRTLLFANRIVMRMEQLPGFHTNMPIAVIGDLENSISKNSAYMFPEIINDIGFRGQYIGTRGNDNNNSYKLSGILDYHLGIPMNPVTDEQVAHISNSPAFLAMDIWPQESSVQIVENIVVIKLNDTLSLKAKKLGSQWYSITLPIAMEFPDDYKYAWYVDAPDGTREYIQWYEPTPSLEYHFNITGKYRITVFVQDSNGEGLNYQSQPFEIE